MKLGEGGILESADGRSIGPLVECVSNSCHSFQVIYMKLATHDPYVV